MASGPRTSPRASCYAGRIAALVNLDSIGSGGSPRIQFAGDTPRVPSPTLLATTDLAVEEQAGVEPQRAGALAQLVDLAFPFSFFEQAPFVSRGVPAVTLTTSGSRPRPPSGDTPADLNEERIGELGRAAQMLVASLDESAEVASGTRSYLYFGTRILYGWTLQLVLVFALIPFLAATVDLFARCRRRHIALLPALRSYLSRLAVWLWLGLVFALFTAFGLLPSGEDRPIGPYTEAAQDWQVAALGALLGVSALAWLIVRPRLTPDALDRARGGARRPPGGDARARGDRPGRHRREPVLAALPPAVAACVALAPADTRPGTRRAGRRLPARVRRAAPPASPPSPSATRWGSTRSGT